MMAKTKSKNERKTLSQVFNLINSWLDTNTPTHIEEENERKFKAIKKLWCCLRKHWMQGYVVAAAATIVTAMFIPYDRDDTRVCALRIETTNTTSYRIRSQFTFPIILVSFLRKRNSLSIQYIICKRVRDRHWRGGKECTQVLEELSQWWEHINMYIEWT